MTSVVCCLVVRISLARSLSRSLSVSCLFSGGLPSLGCVPLCVVYLCVFIACVVVCSCCLYPMSIFCHVLVCAVNRACVV